MSLTSGAPHLGSFRIGSDRYTELYDTYGLTALLREHARRRDGAVLFACTGKHGKDTALAVTDPAACRVLVSPLRRDPLRRDAGGDRLLACWEHRAWHDVESADVTGRTRQRGPGGAPQRPAGPRGGHNSPVTAGSWPP
ncbi:hypothetical protein [Streptomyces caatingaensis]|uniref:Uncharacterized protein n=1 Tax=Streptomyces caatingaensis TaxID=1678637 RepID=A0A0K9XKZ1_9ACTN|nr:hypothetical protein [Streptomyces caatingaensis]KNB54054.1 hypothetical protein AC230_05800 [Streptomyces caatingaensis]